MDDIQSLFDEAILSIAEVSKAILKDLQGLHYVQSELILKYTSLLNEMSITSRAANSKGFDFSVNQMMEQDPKMIQFWSDHNQRTKQLSNCNRFLETLKVECGQFQSTSLEERFEASKHLLPKLTFLKTRGSRDDFNKPLDFKTLNCNP
ncbi:hypothetical protein GH742_09050 [Legionella sp. MW5194]|uniref:hypothetical protein n=1 Tax=Legionella sp. MW5194 TaxID=2662448 RepID=UPI00193CB397|nr:hypothetical protein [Legionella sp. MW5194]QRN04004.1 hypothetical protein GH742_09050 [Legionella sp. MW5194]